MHPLTPFTLWLAVPLATVWVTRQQALIQQRGFALDHEQCLDAHAAGVRFPEKVRFRVTDPVPLPVPLVLRQMLARFGWLHDDVAGMTLGYGIHLNVHWAESREVMVHELVHVAQYERLGGIRPFLQAYLRECLIQGYPHGPLEREAIVRQLQICRQSPPFPERPGAEKVAS
jgi:hypothetical protein